MRPTPLPPPTRDSDLILPWLVGLRWVAAAAQAIGLAGLAWLAPTESVSRVLAWTLAATASTNFGLALLARARTRIPDAGVAAVLILDVAILTTAVAATGGPENPFAILYVVHIAMAVATGRSVWSWSVVGCVVIGYAALFFAHTPTHLWHREIALPIAGGTPVQIHLAGMWLATVIAAVAITYFTRELLRSAEQHRASLRDAERRLERTRHLASLATLAAGAAHELSSPLGAVAVLARELEHEAERGDIENVRAEAAEIRDAVEHCRAILERMRADAARELSPESDGATAAQLQTLVDRELGAARERIVWNTARDTLLGASLPQLAQLVLPLVRNALAASDGERVEVRLASSGQRLRVEVEDHGHGMTREVRERAVEPFFTTRPPGTGMGLGLHLVRTVSEALGGRLTLESEPGEGTLAVLELPVSAVAADALVGRAGERAR